MLQPLQTTSTVPDAAAAPDHLYCSRSCSCCRPPLLLQMLQPLQTTSGPDAALLARRLVKANSIRSPCIHICEVTVRVGRRLYSGWQFFFWTWWRPISREYPSAHMVLGNYRLQFSETDTLIFFISPRSQLRKLRNYSATAYLQIQYLILLAVCNFLKKCCSATAYLQFRKIFWKIRNFKSATRGWHIHNFFKYEGPQFSSAIVTSVASEIFKNIWEFLVREMS